MELRANYLLVGLSCLLLLFAGAICALWLANVQFSARSDVYNVLFEGPVQGLIPGADVRFNGVKIGEVAHLSIDRTNTNRVIVQARVNSDAPIKLDSHASLEPQGLTGDSYIQVSAGTEGSPLLKSTVRPGQTPVLHAQPSAFANLYQGGGEAISLAIEALTRVNKVLSDQNISSINGTLSDVHGVADSFYAHRTIVSDAQNALRDADKAMTQLQTVERSGQGLLDTDGRRAVSNLADAATEVGGAAHELRDFATRLDRPTSDFAANGLPQIAAAAVDLQRTSETLTRMLKEIEANPRDFINKPSPPELDVKR